MPPGRRPRDGGLDRRRPHHEVILALLAFLAEHPLPTSQSAPSSLCLTKVSVVTSGHTLPDAEYLGRSGSGARRTRSGLSHQIPHKLRASSEEQVRSPEFIAVLQRAAACSSRARAVPPCRVASSAFAHFRGAAGVVAADLGHDVHSGLEARLCSGRTCWTTGPRDSPARVSSSDWKRLRRDPARPDQMGYEAPGDSIEVTGETLGLADRRAKTALVRRPYAPTRGDGRDSLTRESSIF